MRPSRRVDVHLCPTDPDAPRPAAVDDVIAAWRASGVLDAHGGPGPAADALVPGGFARVWVDDPGRSTLIANHQGGFYASTPEGAAIQSAAFHAAARAHREGGPRTITVDGRTWPLEALEYRPPAAWARWSIVLGDAAAITLGEAAAIADSRLGPLRRIVRRIG